MPEKIDVGGVVKEYYTAEEIESAKQDAVKAKEGEFKTREQEIEDLQNPNIKVLREKAARLEKLEKSGKVINEKGEVSDAPSALTAEEATRIADERASKQMVDLRKEELLDRYDAETKKVVEHYFNKLIVGETITYRNVSDFMNKAAKLAGDEEPNEIQQKAFAGRGGAPNISIEDKKTDYSDTATGQGVANALGLEINKK